MSFWDFRRSSASVQLLVDYGREHGASAQQLLRGTGLSPPQLLDPHTELSSAQELRVIANLMRSSARPDALGLDVGLRYRYSSYGLWGYGLISSATAADALALALRFIPLTYVFTRISFHRRGELAMLDFGEPALEAGLQRFVVERDMAAAATLMRELAGPDLTLSGLSLRAPRPRDATDGTAPRRLFGAEAVHGAAYNRIAFERRYLDRKLPQANPITAAMCHQLCTELLERRRERGGTASLVRQHLGVDGSQWPDLAAMAQRLNISERTLKRRLQAEGTTYRALLAESRRAMAEDLLADPRMTMSAIADRLGFADLSSFSQAYKRWHGLAPRHRRLAST
jgi:AraC-like DNA-binding protein